MIDRMRRAITIAVALALLPSGAIAYTPYFSVERSPSEPWAGEPVTIVVRTYADPGHTVPGREDELSRAFGTAMTTMDNLLVARSDGMADVAITLHRVEVDRFEGTLVLPAGEWMVETFPGRTGWSSPSLPPGYAGPVRISVLDRDAIEGLAECPVTEPIPAPASFAESLFGSAAAFGNGDLWVGGVGRDGVMLADPAMVAADGTIGWKLGWWRVIPGDLSITGHRLDGDAGPLRSTIPDGYGASGFQASGVDFPTGGCWEITGLAGGEPLSFVTFVAVR